MKPLLGTTERALRKRGIALDRLAVLTLTRDQYAEEPGDPLTLFLGERTHYRPAAYLLDEFARADGALGTGYGPWETPTGFDDLVLADEAVTAAVLTGTDSFAVHARALPRDQWAEVTIRDLERVTGLEALVGVGVRVSAVDGDGNGYFAQAVHQASGGPVTRLVKYVAGTASTLAEVATPWAAGEALRLVAQWNRLRVYRQGVLILEHTDASSPIMDDRQAALQVVRLHADDAAAVDAFLAGPFRQEYAGLLADVGDVSAGLGLVEPTATPASWELTVVNCAPVGGADRFAALIRHGENDELGTYDVDLAPTRTLVAISGGSGPMPSAAGRVEQLTDVTEGTARLLCRGDDAFLRPAIEVGEVAYLPGDDPTVAPAPVPEDPCGADAEPDVVPGDAPAEPPVEDAPEGVGPEAPEEEEPEPDGSPGLSGVYRIVMEYRRGDPEADPPEPEWVKTTTVTQWPPPSLLGSCDPEVTNRQHLGFHFDGDEVSIGPPYSVSVSLFWGHYHRPNETDPTKVVRRVVAFYRGADIGATHLRGELDALACLGLPGADAARVEGGTTGGFVPHDTGANDQAGFSAEATLARYDASAITTLAHLEALTLAAPDESADYRAALPTRIESLVSWTQTGINDLGSGTDGFDTFGMTKGGAIEPEPLSTGEAVPLTQLAGPTLLVLELGDLTGFSALEDYAVFVRLSTGLFASSVYQGFGGGPSFGSAP